MREFMDCYIAFLDILGFRELMKKSDSDLCERVAGLFDRIQEEWTVTIENTDDYLCNPGCINQKVMSDSICFYVETSVHNALAGLVATCDYFQVRLSRQDVPVLARGAIVRGDLYVADDVVFGKGLVDAVLMEENDSRWPRIILTKALIKECQNLDGFGKDYVAQFSFEDDDAFITVDYLYLFYGLSHEKEDWKQFVAYVNDRVNEETDATIKEKYLYLRRNIMRASQKYMERMDKRSSMRYLTNRDQYERWFN